MKNTRRIPGSLALSLALMLLLARIALARRYGIDVAPGMTHVGGEGEGHMQGAQFVAPPKAGAVVAPGMTPKAPVDWSTYGEEDMEGSTGEDILEAAGFLSPATHLRRLF